MNKWRKIMELFKVTFPKTLIQLCGKREHISKNRREKTIYNLWLQLNSTLRNTHRQNQGWYWLSSIVSKWSGNEQLFYNWKKENSNTQALYRKKHLTNASSLNATGLPLPPVMFCHICFLLPLCIFASIFLPLKSRL